MQCIYCKKTHNKISIEHIIPESIGCPENAVLKNGEICEHCNHLLGHRVDVHLKDAFDLLTFHYQIKRKKNKLPVVSSRGNFVTEYKNGKPHFIVNSSNIDQFTELGKKISKFDKDNPRHVSFKSQTVGNIVHFNMQANLSASIGFTRGIYKIAYEWITFKKGAQYILDPKFDPIRDFIMNGKPIFRCINTLDKSGKYETELYNNLWEKKGEYITIIKLFGMEYICDINPGNSLLDEIITKMNELGEKNYLILPKTDQNG